MSYVERLDAETAAERLGAIDLRRPCVRRYVPEAPHPRQAAMLALADRREVLFGGAAGGGKTSTLMMDALQYACVPGYAAVLFRQTYPQLSREDGLLDRMEEWLGPTDAEYRAADRRWRFPSGATVTLAYAERDEDRYNFAGPAYHYAGFDELTNWRSDKVYRYVGFARLRKPTARAGLAACPSCGLTVADVPLRTRAGTNPGGPGSGWVYERFIAPWRDWREGRVESPPERAFLPSRLRDNPSLDYDSYVEGLNELDPVERARLLDGDWDVRDRGEMFDRSWFPIVDDYPTDAKLVRYWDLAATEAKAGRDPDWTAGALVAFDDGRWWIVEVRRVRATPGRVESLIAQTAELDGRSVPIVMEQEPGSSGVATIDHYARRVLPGYAFRGDRVSGSKAERARILSSAAEAGNVSVVRGPWVAEFLDEVEQFPLGAHDDQVDAVVGALGALAGRSGRGGLRYS